MGRSSEWKDKLRLLLNPREIGGESGGDSGLLRFREFRGRAVEEREGAVFERRREVCRIMPNVVTGREEEAGEESD